MRSPLQSLDPAAHTGNHAAVAADGLAQGAAKKQANAVAAAGGKVVHRNVDSRFVRRAEARVFKSPAAVQAQHADGMGIVDQQDRAGVIAQHA